MNKTIKIASLLLALCFALSLVACGGGSDDTFSVTSRDPIDLGTVSKNDGTVNSNDNNSGYGDEITISMPDFNLGDTGLEEKTVFVTPAEAGASGEFKIYHKDNVIKSITMTTSNDFPGYTADQMKQVIKEADENFAEFAKNDFVSYSCTASGTTATIVIAMRNLDENGNQAKVAEQEFMSSLEADTTYSEFEAILLDGGFIKQ